MDHHNFTLLNSLEIKTSGGLKMISIKHITYIEAAGKCSIIYMDDSRVIVTYHLIKWYNNNLKEPFFFRNHNSYLVNCQFVDCYSIDTIILLNKTKLPLSRDRFISFKKCIRLILEVAN